ncbi:MAG: hypothetical protein IH784_09670 [Bacteroidetes bacterium]|nr:hypothetical protein [Bacteroidota bacterium]
MQTKTHISGYPHVAAFTSWFRNMKAETLKSRAKTIRLNRFLKRDGQNPLPVEPIYTLKIFANDLGCNYNSLRKFMSGKGRLTLDVLGAFEHLKEKEYF